MSITFIAPSEPGVFQDHLMETFRDRLLEVYDQEEMDDWDIDIDQIESFSDVPFITSEGFELAYKAALLAVEDEFPDERAFFNPMTLEVYLIEDMFVEWKRLSPSTIKKVMSMVRGNVVPLTQGIGVMEIHRDLNESPDGLERCRQLYALIYS